MTIKLEKGKRYRDRIGNIIQIVKDDSTAVPNQPFEDNQRQQYSENGAFRSDGESSSYDLIEEIIQPIQEDRQGTGLRIRFGGRYRCRNNVICTVVAKNVGENRPYKTDLEKSYNGNGKYRVNGLESEWDLVEFLGLAEEIFGSSLSLQDGKSYLNGHDGTPRRLTELLDRDGIHYIDQFGIVYDQKGFATGVMKDAKLNLCQEVDHDYDKRKNEKLERERREHEQLFGEVRETPIWRFNTSYPLDQPILIWDYQRERPCVLELCNNEGPRLWALPGVPKANFSQVVVKTKNIKEK